MKTMKNPLLASDRRSFLRLVGGSALVSAFAPPQLFGATGKGADGVLLEASSIASRGGWLLDTQHYHQMGGCYLLAHGMGEPVAPARARVEVPEAGEWHVFVRTRDWCPGEWQAPGRFKVAVGGRELEPEFGTEPGWTWQRGGKVDLKAGEVEIELRDLSGFDGRCDAIFLSREAEPELPNEDLVELTAWKDRLAGRAGLEVAEHDFDVVIVGGGIAGCGAALAARSQGLKVALIQDRPLFGGNASEEIRVHTLGVHGKGGGILETIDTPHYPNGSAEAKEAQAKRERTMRESGVELFAGHLAVGLEKDGDRIASVEAREVVSGRIKRFRAPVFVDASGDGWLGYWAGAEYREGREARSEFGESWDKHGDLWSPEKPDAKVMGASVLWNSERGSERVDFPAVPWAMPVAKHHKATEGEWYWEYSSPELDQIEDAEAIRDHLLRAIYGSFANAKKSPKNATVKLKWVAHIAGKRESRRLVGDHLYVMGDATSRTEFPDTVVEETRELDAHYQLVETGSPLDFLSEALFRKTGGTYFIRSAASTRVTWRT